MSVQGSAGRGGGDHGPGLGRPGELAGPDFASSYDPSAPMRCDRCGHEMIYTASCRMVCRNCGYQRDCSDP